MNSFKKIALGMVAAMTLGTIVATPASANSVTLAVTTSVAGSGTAAAPFEIKVPSDNTVDTSTATASEFLTVQATVPTGAATTFTAIGNAKIVTTTGSTVASTAGVTTLTVTPAAETATVYVFTTSTAASALTVSVTGASRTIYLKGQAGPAYNVTLSVPTSGNIGGTATATANVSDVFGNAVATAPTFTAINATAGSATVDPLVVGRYTSTVTLPTTAGTAAVGASITATAVATLTEANADLAAEKAARDADKAAAAKALADAVAAEKAKADAAAVTAAADLVKANAEIAKLKAEAVTAKAAADKALADAIAKASADAATAKAASDKSIADLKAAFNKLARSWNKKNPTAKVALVK
jgi:hypothetical protein